MNSQPGYLGADDLYVGMELWVMYATVQENKIYLIGNVFLPVRLLREYPRYWICEVLPHKNPDGFAMSKYYQLTLDKFNISIHEIILKKMK